MGENLRDLWLATGFLYLSSKVQSTKGETDKLDFIKIKNFHSEKIPVKKIKKNKTKLRTSKKNLKTFAN